MLNLTKEIPAEPARQNDSADHSAVVERQLWTAGDGKSELNPSASVERSNIFQNPADKDIVAYRNVERGLDRITTNAEEYAIDPANADHQLAEGGESALWNLAAPDSRWDFPPIQRESRSDEAYDFELEHSRGGYGAPTTDNSHLLASTTIDGGRDMSVDKFGSVVFDDFTPEPVDHSGLQPQPPNTVTPRSLLLESDACVVAPSKKDTAPSVNGEVPSPNHANSLPNEAPQAAGNIGGATVLSSLPIFDPSWSNVQQLIYQELEKLAPSTIFKSSQRFMRFMRLMRSGAIESNTYRPSTRAANRAFLAALLTGAKLNALHPNLPIANRWTQYFHPEIEDTDLDHVAAQLLNLVSCLSNRTEFECRQGRRKRLSKLPDYWYEISFDWSKTSSVALRSGHLLLMLTGCRSCEVAAIEATWNDSGLDLRIENGKRRAAHVALNGTHRDLHLKFSGSSGHFVKELVNIFKTYGLINKDVGAKSLENFLARNTIRAWPQVRPGLNAYCYRNLMIADLKADGWSTEEIAYLVGHTPKVTSSYGTSSQGRKGRRNYLLIQRHVNVQRVADHAGRARPRPKH